MAKSTHCSTPPSSGIAARLLVAPLLLILAGAATSSHAEVPPHLKASLRADNNSKRETLMERHQHQLDRRTPAQQQQQQQQSIHPAEKNEEERRQRRRRAQTTLDELLDNAIDGTTPTQCTLNDNGLYGDPVGGTNVAVVDYLYQISVLPATTRAQLNSVVVPELDAAIPTATLPVFFPATCTSATTTGGGRRERERHQRQLQSGTVQAISMMPQDELVMDGCKYYLPLAAGIKELLPKSRRQTAHANSSYILWNRTEILRYVSHFCNYIFFLQ